MPHFGGASGGIVRLDRSRTVSATLNEKLFTAQACPVTSFLLIRSAEVVTGGLLDAHSAAIITHDRETIPATSRAGE